MVQLLSQLGRDLPKPDRILLVSAHWEASPLQVLAAPRHALYYDYYNFPEPAYAISYPAPGCPELADQVQGLLEQAGIACQRQTERGYDHGMFVPLKIIYPAADIPTIQLSLHPGLDPELHLCMGEALASLGPNTLVMGSGFSFHNQPAFRTEDARMNQMNRLFEAWLVDTCGNPQLSEEQRRKRLRRWKLAPGAMACHPREEHLLPLHFCYGAAGRACSNHWQIPVMGKLGSFLYWNDSSDALPTH